MYDIKETQVKRVEITYKDCDYDLAHLRIKQLEKEGYMNMGWGINRWHENVTTLEKVIKTTDKIELTDDWLLKFGFNKNGFNCFEKDINLFDEGHRMLLFVDDYLYISHGDSKNRNHESDLVVLWNKDIKKKFYVDELQNLYQAITGSELKLDESNK